MRLLLESARAVIARAKAWAWTRPLMRGALGVAVLLVLVVVGRATFAGATPKTIEADVAGSAQAPEPAATPEPAVLSVAEAPGATASAPATAQAEAPPPPQPTAHGPATPEDPVVLNDATAEDLQRLPGIGQKRALAILDLRTRLGRFHQIEDLLEVRGIGLKTLRRLRPLVRLDRPPPPPDAGSP
jgi:competence protein ComEA